MIFEGKVIRPRRGSRYWEVKIHALGIFTQGNTEKDAYIMAADALKTVVDKRNFSVEIIPTGRGKFLISANDPTPLIARWLYRLRIESGLTVREAALRLGASSPEAWARYESGRASPTIEKLSDLLHAVAPETKYALKKLSLPPLKKAS
ncbi:MAG: helix-turn-helix transcriptional regulator [Deltaproteobacteria bacterium]|nr:helix-turn-helix transcriptional regulator [Deltaproteobacteria bacterium]